MARSQHGLGSEHAEPSGGERVSGDYFTSEQLSRLAWQVAGATMAALGVAREDIAAYGKLVEPTINEILVDHGITVPERSQPQAAPPESRNAVTDQTQ